MIITKDQKELLNILFEKLKLSNRGGKKGDSKLNQILSYLEIISANTKNFSKKRPLVFVESCAGNCYLSFVVYYYFKFIKNRDIFIHCIDINEILMKKANETAKQFGFSGMIFHSMDVHNFSMAEKVDAVFSLHACNTATDATIYLGIRNRVKVILSVSCCQHQIRKKFRNPRYREITRHSLFKDRLAYMVSDSLRAMLLEMNGYKADIFEFTSSRNTDKNAMIRAAKNNNFLKQNLWQEYEKISTEFKIKPQLEEYLNSRD